MNTPPYQRY